MSRRNKIPDKLKAGLAEVMKRLGDGHPLEITAMELPGLGVRVLMGAGGKMLAMGIVEARRVAAAFDTPAAHAAGLNVCTDLRDAADAAEAHGATRQ